MGLRRPDSLNLSLFPRSLMTRCLTGNLLFWAASLLLFASSAAGYEVPVLDTDYSRQICSGMWSSQNTFINGTRPIYEELPTGIKLGLVSFDSTSQGHLAMVIYEWRDYQYLGKVTSETEEQLPVSVVLRRQPRHAHVPLLAEDVCMYLRCCTRWLLRWIQPRSLHSRPSG